nr:glycosyltransferase [Mycolicibacterium gilvum]
MRPWTVGSDRVKSRQIRVVFIVPDLRVGGAERHVTTLLPQMNREKFTTSVICIGEEGSLFSALPEAGVSASAMHLGHKRNAGHALIRLIASIKRLQPDIVVVRGYNAEVLGRIAARMGGTRHIIVWVHHIGDAKPRSSVRKLSDHILERWTSRYFGVANAQRNYMMNELRLPRHKIRIIHNGVDPGAFSTQDDRQVLGDLDPRLGSGTPVVGMIAALRPEKDHKNAFLAARIVLEQLPSVKFLIVGDGPMRAELEEYALALGISESVHFVGTRRDIGRLLPAITVFTLSSATVECFPIALLEAMACARPAVCTDVGGVGEILRHGETGFLVPPKCPQMLAARLLDLLNSPRDARRMGLAGRRRVENCFNLSQSVLATEAEFEQLFSSGRTR